MDAYEPHPSDPVPHDERSPMRASDQDRTTAVAVLGDAYAAGRLDYAEFQERTDRAWKSVYTSDLEALLRDVPSHQGAQLAHPDASGSRLPRVSGKTGPGVSAAVMSGQERNGPWTCPARHTVVSVMGGVVLDLRDAEFESADTVITCHCVMGGVDVIVPDDIDIEVSGLGIMGEFAASREVTGVRRPGNGVRVRITGYAVMGGVGIERKERGED